MTGLLEWHGLQVGDPARPDFVALVYPGPTPFTRNPDTPVPDDAPPTFIVCAGTGDAVHAVWADAYFGSSSRAFKWQATASSSFPWSLRATPRLLWASA